MGDKRSSQNNNSPAYQALTCFPVLMISISIPLIVLSYKDKTHLSIDKDILLQPGCNYPDTYIFVYTNVKPLCISTICRIKAIPYKTGRGSLGGFGEIREGMRDGGGIAGKANECRKPDTRYLLPFPPFASNSSHPRH